MLMAAYIGSHLCVCMSQYVLPLCIILMYSCFISYDLIGLIQHLCVYICVYVCHFLVYVLLIIACCICAYVYIRLIQ